MDYKIALIRGDGIGPEIVNEAVGIIDAVGERFGHTFSYTDVDLGGCAAPATLCCWVPSEVPSGDRTGLPLSGPKPLCWRSERISACMPICVMPHCVRHWWTPRR